LTTPPRPTLLIVDDEPEHCQLLSVILQRDYIVHATPSPERALEIAATEPLAAALVDFRMPGMVGTVLLARLAEMQPDCVRFLVTAYGDSGVLGRAINEGHVYRYIAKPVDPEQLRLDLRRAIEHRGARLDLERARGMAIVGSLVASVIHDLRNYLVVLRTAPDLLEDSDDELVQEVADRLRKVETSISDLVAELLALARGKAPTYNRTRRSLVEIAESAVSLLRHDPDLRGRTLTLDVDGDIPDLELSRSRCERLIGNLLRNAREATAEDGTITCRIRLVDAGVELTVEDDGEGVQAHQLPSIFDPTFTTKSAIGGSGFGLAICAKVMQGHGGTLRCESDPGTYTRFTAKFPLP
jgi:signal transduction histidine kinase